MRGSAVLACVQAQFPQDGDLGKCPLSQTMRRMSVGSSSGYYAFGNEQVLGLQQGTTENVEVVTSLLEDLQSRGIDFNQPRLYVLDGNQALRRAIVKFPGQAAFI